MTDFIPMQNIYKLALALTSKEIGKISEDQISATQPVYMSFCLTMLNHNTINYNTDTST